MGLIQSILYSNKLLIINNLCQYNSSENWRLNPFSFSTISDIGFGFVDSIDDNAELSFGVNSKFSDKISEYSVDANYHYKF